MGNIHPLLVVGRGSETQLEASENLDKKTWRERANKIYLAKVMRLIRSAVEQ